LNAFKEIAKKCDEIGQGIDVANRDSTEVEKLIGFFVNQVVLRTDLGVNLRFATDLFEATTVARVRNRFAARGNRPQLPLSALKNILVEVGAQRRADEQARLEAKSLRKLKRIKRRGISLAS